MKSCSTCGHKCANAAGYCCHCLRRFSGCEARTPDPTDDRLGPYLATGFMLIVSMSILSAGWWMVTTPDIWDMVGQVWFKAFKS